MIRPATKRDALHMAALADIAGHGMPAWVWSQACDKGQSVIEVGRARAMRDDATSPGAMPHAGGGRRDRGDAARLRQPDTMDAGDTSTIHEVFRAMAELEAAAPGSWYVNILGVFPEYRGRGLGSRLLRRAEELADATGTRRMSLIVDSGNDGARRLYERTGYREETRRPMVPFPGSTASGDWVLMVKEI
jgi:ribosomal protein S18 acetylase RimI-like enzyme